MVADFLGRARIIDIASIRAHTYLLPSELKNLTRVSLFWPEVCTVEESFRLM